METEVRDPTQSLLDKAAGLTPQHSKRGAVTMLTCELDRRGEEK